MFGTEALVLDAADAVEEDPDVITIDGSIPGVERFKLVPGLSVTLTVPPDAVTVIISSGGVATAATSAQDYSAADVMLFVDDHPAPAGAYQRVTAAPPIKLANWNLHISRPISPGPHTFAVKARAAGGSVDATLSGTSRSAASATLTVMFLRR